MKSISALIISSFLINPTSAQFIDNFDGKLDGWTFRTGDGTATIDFQPADGHASILVDATGDKQNIWWALIRHEATGLDLGRLSKPDYELRIEARIKVSHAPRRVNLHLNTQRTTDFHSNLMEFDIPDTVNWHTISMTTKDFDARVGDEVGAQLALMDWGRGNYRIDLDYFKVDLVNTKKIGPDKGTQLPYRPPIPDPATFQHHIPVAQDGIIDSEYPDLNFNNWQTRTQEGVNLLLTVSETQIVILRWDLSELAGKQAVGPGLLELTTQSVQRSPEYEKDFGMVRVTEILGGDPGWNEEVVTYNLFMQGKPLDMVLNTQMIIDTDVTKSQLASALFTISQPVLQRMIDGRTVGLAIRPLGAVSASFYSKEHQDGKFRPKLHLDTVP